MVWSAFLGLGVCFRSECSVNRGRFGAFSRVWRAFWGHGGRFQSKCSDSRFRFGVFWAASIAFWDVASSFDQSVVSVEVGPERFWWCGQQLGMCRAVRGRVQCQLRSTERFLYFFFAFSFETVFSRPPLLFQSGDYALQFNLPNVLQCSVMRSFHSSLFHLRLSRPRPEGT